MVNSNDIWIHLVVVNCWAMLCWNPSDPIVIRIQWVHGASTLLASACSGNNWEQLSTDIAQISTAFGLQLRDTSELSELHGVSAQFKKGHCRMNCWCFLTWILATAVSSSVVMLSFEEMVAANPGSIGWCRAASMSCEVRGSFAGRGCVGIGAKVWAEPQGAPETLQDAQTTKSTSFSQVFVQAF